MTELESGGRLAADRLRDAIDGAVLVPADAAYDTARIGGGTVPVDDRHPSVIVQPAAPADVARALEFADRHDLAVSVRSGGHDLLGASTGATGLLIDLARLDTVRIDPAAGIAVAGGGVRAGELVAAAAPHGFAPVVGMCNNVGLGGLTLGGGLGWTSGTQGAVADNLVAAEIVTADGRVLRADADTNPDLFWAIRGGGGNFGIATSFTYRMPRTRTVLAGTISVRADVGAVLRFLREYWTQTGDELSVSVLIVPGRRPESMFAFCWVGDEREGERAIAPLRDLAPVVDESVSVQPFVRFMAETGDAPPRMLCRAGSLDGLDDAAVDAFAAIAEQDAPADCVIAIGHYMRGALCRVPADATPLIRQPGKVLYDVYTTWNGGPQPADQVRWVHDSADTLRPRHAHQGYVNYLDEGGDEVVRAAYGPHFARLAEIKRRYDPANVFRGNRNIAGG